MAESSNTTGTRASLILAALHLFGRKGYDGTSTRAIADRAGTNVASIAYHFEGKSGLRRACAELVGERISGALAPFDAATPPETPEAAHKTLRNALRAFVGLVVGSSEAEDMVSFVVRELSEPGPVADQLFDTVFLPRHARFCALWSMATGQPAESEEVKLTVFAMIGQVAYFRIAQPFVARRMAWDTLGPAEADRIAEVLLRNLDHSLKGRGA